MWSCYSDREAQVLKWARFVFRIIIYKGVNFRSYADWLACRSMSSGEERNVGEKSVLGSMDFVKMLISRTNA